MKMKLFNMRKKKTKLNKIYIFRSLLIVTLSSLSLTHTHFETQIIWHIADFVCCV